jgi:predicted DNA-binding transcriptional regulator AlpA
MARMTDSGRKAPIVEVRLITANELGKAWSVPVGTVYRWGREGKIPREVLGDRTVRFPCQLLNDPRPTSPKGA